MIKPMIKGYKIVDGKLTDTVITGSSISHDLKTGTALMDGIYPVDFDSSIIKSWLTNDGWMTLPNYVELLQGAKQNEKN